MLSFPTYDRRDLKMVRHMLPTRTHLGCVVERSRTVRLFQNTLHTGPVMEFITLSAPREIYEQACVSL